MILGSAATGGAKRYWNDLDGTGWHTGGRAWPRSSQQPLGVHLGACTCLSGKIVMGPKVRFPGVDRAATASAVGPETATAGTAYIGKASDEITDWGQLPALGSALV